MDDVNGVDGERRREKGKPTQTKFPAGAASPLQVRSLSLDDWRPEYLAFRSNCPTQWSVSQVGSAWCEQFTFERGSTAADAFHTVARFTWGDFTAISYMRDRSDKTTVIVNGETTAVEKNLAEALDCLRSNDLCRLGLKIWVDALCIDQDDVVDRNTHVMRIRDIFSQPFAVTVWLGTDEMSDMGLTSCVESSFDRLQRCEEILDGHGREALDAALGIGVSSWRESDRYDEDLEADCFSSTEVLYFDDTWWPDSDDDSEFGPPHFRDLVALALLRLVENPYWTRLWTIQELAVSPTSPTLQWGDASVSLGVVLTLADVFCDKDFSVSLNSEEIAPRLQLLQSIGQWQKSATFSDREGGLQGTSLDTLRRLASTTQCTIPHDNVYGLLGLLPRSISSNVKIDYKRDEVELLSEFEEALSSPALLTEGER